MKKISVLLLTLALIILGLAACGPTADKDPILKNEECTYHIVGGHAGDWAAKDENKMEPISMGALKTLDESVAKALEGKKVKYLYKVEGYEMLNSQSWTSNANGEQLNGGFSVKVIRAKYDAEDEAYVNDAWLPDPHTTHVESLTPATLFIPKWVESAAAGEEALGTWADNPMVLAGCGKYTIIFAEYDAISSADVAGFGMAVIQTQELPRILTDGEKLEAEYKGLKDGSITTATEFTVTGEIVELSVVYSEKYSNYSVKAVIDVDGVKVGVYDGQIKDAEGNLVYPKTEADVVGLEKGKSLTVKGKLAADKTLTLGDFTNIMDFSKPEISWAKTMLLTAKAPEGVTAMNAYWWESAESCGEWPGKAMEAKNGLFEIEFPLDAKGLIFNWDGGQTADLTPAAELIYWEVGTANKDGKYAAQGYKAIMMDVTVDVATFTETKEHDTYVWFWGDNTPTGWFEPVAADGKFKVPAGTTGCCFAFMPVGTAASWDAKLSQTDNYAIANGVATPEA